MSNTKAPAGKTYEVHTTATQEALSAAPWLVEQYIRPMLDAEAKALCNGLGDGEVHYRVGDAKLVAAEDKKRGVRVYTLRFQAVKG